jgi:hypothetical protein
MDEAPLTFRMQDRKEVTVKDKSGKICLVRVLDDSEVDSLMLKYDQALPVQAEVMVEKAEVMVDKVEVVINGKVQELPEIMDREVKEDQ